MFAVIFETGYSTKILFSGSKEDCKTFMKLNPEQTSSYCFIQEIDEEYNYA